MSNERGLTPAQVERRRCVAIVRKSAAFYRELVAADPGAITADTYTIIAAAIEQVAQDIEDA